MSEGVAIYKRYYDSLGVWRLVPGQDAITYTSGAESFCVVNIPRYHCPTNSYYKISALIAL